MKNFILCTLSLGLALAQVAEAGPARETPNPLPADELARKGTHVPQRPRILAPADTVMYSATTVGGTSWARPFDDCTGVSGLGPVLLHNQPFFVGVTGAYDLTSIQDGGWDGFILVYENSFNSAAPNTNCLFANDDGVNGVGESELFGIPLSVGTQYFLITTAFEAGEEGTFDNTIDGPGTITLGTLGAPADLAITKTTPIGFVGNGVPFTFEISVTNNGPNAANGVTVTDPLPATLTYVSDTCGGTNTPPWTWAIGTLANGASANCTITVTMAAACAPANNTASVSSSNVDPTPADNSASAINAPDAIADGSFEDGTPNGFWTEASTNFGTPLCNEAGCGLGTGTGPRTGDWWAWFGGISAPEVGSVTQSVTIPVGATTLTFWTEAPVCANATDFMRLLIDGNQEFELLGNDPSCNSVGYVERTVDVSAYANGASHTVVFTSTTSGVPSGTNFFVDDVSLLSATCSAAPGGIDIDKTASSPSAPLGGNIVYTLTVTATGPADASGVVVTDTLPAGVTYVSNDCGAAFAAPTLTWNVGTVPFPGSDVCNVTVTVNSSGPIVNTASVVAVGATATQSSVTITGASANIPTLGEWGFLALAAGLALAGLAFLRRGH